MCRPSRLCLRTMSRFRGLMAGREHRSRLCSVGRSQLGPRMPLWSSPTHTSDMWLLIIPSNSCRRHIHLNRGGSCQRGSSSHSCRLSRHHFLYRCGRGTSTWNRFCYEYSTSQCTPDIYCPPAPDWTWSRSCSLLSSKGNTSHRLFCSSQVSRYRKKWNQVDNCSLARLQCTFLKFC